MGKKKKVGRPKADNPLSEQYRLRVTQEQKELIMEMGTADFWRGYMIEKAKKIKGQEFDFEDLEVKEKLRE